jgi:uncharacterized phage protein (TIGR01671 family)
MREIEFRGWDADNKRWVYGYYVHWIDATPHPIGAKIERDEFIKKHSHYYIVNDGFSDWGLPRPLIRTDVEPESVGQWTGLYDRNNKKIFEGDIVAYDEHYGGDHRIKAGKLTVVFEEGGFDLECTNGYWVESLAYLVLNNCCEVIGNIKETPVEVS